MECLGVGTIGSMAAYVWLPRQCRYLSPAACVLALAAFSFIGHTSHLSDKPYYRQSQGHTPCQKSNDLSHIHRHHLPSRVRRCLRYAV